MCKVKAVTQHKSKAAAYIAAMKDDGIIDWYVNLVEDKRTTIRKSRSREV